MLVLTRKLQEAIKIGDNITLTVIKVKGNTVRLGIEAPRNVRILRTELPPDEVVDQGSPEVSAEVVVEPHVEPHVETLERPIVAEACADFDEADEFALPEQPVPAPRPAPLARARRPRLMLATAEATAK